MENVKPFDQNFVFQRIPASNNKIIGIFFCFARAASLRSANQWCTERKNQTIESHSVRWHSGFSYNFLFEHFWGDFVKFVCFHLFRVILLLSVDSRQTFCAQKFVKLEYFRFRRFLLQNEIGHKKCHHSMQCACLLLLECGFVQPPMAVCSRCVQEYSSCHNNNDTAK